MKKIKLLSVLLLLCLLSTPVIAIRSIHFGNYWYRSCKSIIQDPIPFDAYINDTNRSIQINFKQNTEELTIKITDQNGNEVFSTTSNFQEKESLQIKLNYTEIKNYTIIVTDKYHWAMADLQLI